MKTFKLSSRPSASARRAGTAEIADVSCGPGSSLRYARDDNYEKGNTNG